MSATKNLKLFAPLQTKTDDKRLHFTIDDQGTMWAAEFGVQLYGVNLLDSTVILQSSRNSNIQSAKFFRRPFVDQIGSVWIPCEDIYRLHLNRGFHHLHIDNMNSRSVSAIHVDDQHYWLAIGDEGLVQIDRRKHTHTFYNPPQKKLAKTSVKFSATYHTSP